MTVDWKRIEEDLQSVMWKMLNEEGKKHGPGFYTEALQRTLGYVAPGVRGPNDHLDYRLGVVSHDEAIATTRGEAAHADMLRERAEQQVKEMREEVRRVYREAAADLADSIRGRCNERSVPSKLRRDGVAWAADLIDPRVPKDRYGNIVKPSASPAAVTTGSKPDGGDAR